MKKIREKKKDVNKKIAKKRIANPLGGEEGTRIKRWNTGKGPNKITKI